MSSTMQPSRAQVEDQQRALLARLAELEAQDSRLYASRMELRAQMDQLWNDPEAGWAQEQFGVLELAGTARIGQTRAPSQLVNGTRLVQTMPRTLAALQSGQLYAQSAVLLLELTSNCTAAVVAQLEIRLLPAICTMNTTELRRLLLTTISEVEADLDPELTQERLASARSGRHVGLSDRGDGMTAVTAEIDAVSARRWALDFEELVRAQKVADRRAGVDRTADQRRADVFAQLPSRFLALLLAVRMGKTEQLLALALEDPDLADHLEALATALPQDHLPEAETEAAGEGQSTAEAEPVEQVVVQEPAGWEREEPPLPPEPPPVWTRDPDPPELAPSWTDLSPLELASLVMHLPVKNPMVLNVHIPMTTLLELDQRTGAMDGGGALPACHARLLVPDAALRRVFVDPTSGVPLGLDPQLFPPASSAADGPASGTPDSGPPLVRLPVRTELSSGCCRCSPPSPCAIRPSPGTTRAAVCAS